MATRPGSVRHESAPEVSRGKTWPRTVSRSCGGLTDAAVHCRGKTQRALRRVLAERWCLSSLRPPRRRRPITSRGGTFDQFQSQRANQQNVDKNDALRRKRRFCGAQPRHFPRRPIWPAALRARAKTARRQKLRGGPIRRAAAGSSAGGSAG